MQKIHFIHHLCMFISKYIQGGTVIGNGGRDNPSNSPSIGSAPIDDGEKRRQETALDGAIVESIPGNALSAEDSDPQVFFYFDNKKV